MNLSKALETAAVESGEKAAYYFIGQTATYEELNESVNQFAAGLREIGIGQGDHLALIAGNSPHFIISLYGAMRAGVTVIPINPVYSSEEVSYIVENSHAKAVVLPDVLAPMAERLCRTLPAVEHYIVFETMEEKVEGSQAWQPAFYQKVKTFSDLLQTARLPFDPPPIQEEQTAVILYTSGTTGKPKGAMLTHKNLYSNARDIGTYLQFSKEDSIITVLPMFHVFCLSVCLNASIIKGATMIISPKFSPKEVFALSKEYKATVFAGVPTMYNFLLQSPEGRPEDLASLRLCISGGASMPVALLENFEKKFSVRISEGYGLSEASPVTAFNPLDRPRKPGSIGRSIINVQNKVVNAEGAELPPGEVGELIVKGPNVMKGYYKQPEETASVLKDGWLYTGDLARMDEEGYFYIVDRKKDLIIVGGYNVYPREVEEVLYSHPDIVEAAVLGVPDAEYGEAVLAFVVSKNDRLSSREVRAYCESRLAQYKQPKEIELLEELPKNATGKILRRALREQVLPNRS